MQKTWHESFFFLLFFSIRNGLCNTAMSQEVLRILNEYVWMLKMCQHTQCTKSVCCAFVCSNAINYIWFRKSEMVLSLLEFYVMCKQFLSYFSIVFGDVERHSILFWLDFHPKMVYLTMHLDLFSLLSCFDSLSSKSKTVYKSFVFL